MKLKMNEIRTKDSSELQRILTETQEELRHLKTKAGAQDLKNVRSIRQLRQVVARVKTYLSELSASKTE